MAKQKPIDINSLTIEQAEALSVALGQKTTKICADAAEKINKILNIYGLNATISVELTGIESKATENNLSSAVPTARA